MPAEPDAVPNRQQPDAVPRDRDVLPTDGHQVPSAADQVSGGGYFLPRVNNQMSPCSDVLPGGDHDLPADGHQVPVCHHPDALPRGRNLVSAIEHPVPCCRHPVPGGSDQVPAATRRNDVCSDPRRDVHGHGRCRGDA
jgi:hypothetical protein